MLSSPPPEESPAASELRGRFFGDLDRLAFALEMEAAELVERGDEAAAARRQELRLGVRLAQRLVAGVWADEVDERLGRWAADYDARLNPGVPSRTQAAGPTNGNSPVALTNGNAPRAIAPANGGSPGDREV